MVVISCEKKSWSQQKVQNIDGKKILFRICCLYWIRRINLSQESKNLQREQLRTLLPPSGTAYECKHSVTVYIINTLPGLNLSEQVKYPPWLHAVPMPHRSFTTTVSLTGLSLYSHARNSVEPQYSSGASQSPSDHMISGL